MARGLGGCPALEAARIYLPNPDVLGITPVELILTMAGSTPRRLTDRPARVKAESHGQLNRKGGGADAEEE